MKFLQTGLMAGLASSLMITSLASPAITQTTLADRRSDEQITVDVYGLASPAVVTIKLPNGTGSGTIIRPDGLVLTNNHVIRNAGRFVTVVTSTGKQYQGQVLSFDRLNDLALIKLQTSDRLPSLKFANPSSIQVGRQVFAIGSPFGLSGTLTRGIISRIAANGDIQTDAALNPGNSGGPLLNSRAELIGVNKAILAPDGRGNTGIGFATSAQAAQQFIARSFAPGGAIANQPSTPKLGVVVDSDTLVIQQVEANSLASSAGLRPGDRLLAANGTRLRGIQQLSQALDQSQGQLILTVARRNQVGRVLIRF
ncbi:MAG: trypsin-like peptidase domain-containing protein [Pseudanabaenaceae cyanobacterium bins.68]|nr:trypsin-like peptidase domain-containing protein [Pseudanabaenaceae cyanobacterium bins.68]